MPRVLASGSALEHKNEYHRLCKAAIKAASPARKIKEQ